MSARTIVRSVTLSTGVTLQYGEQGDPAGEPVLLLHGVTDSWHSFEPMLSFLPSNLRVFAVTQRGHGDSGKPDDGYGMRDFAEDVAAFMDAVGLKTAVIAGSSMGSSVAQRFALEYPERVKKIVLMASFYSYEDKPELVEFWSDAIDPLTDPIDRGFVQEFQESTLARPIPPEFLDLVVDESMKVPARVWRGVFGGIIKHDEPIEFNRIMAPTLIIWGDQDAYCPRRDQEMLLAAIPNSRLAVYEDHGHAMHWEDPKRTAADIVAFIEGVDS